MYLQVNVQVIDVNDNEPRFIFPKTIDRFGKRAYFGAIARDKEVSSPVLQIKVTITLAIYRRISNPTSIWIISNYLNNQLILFISFYYRKCAYLQDCFF